MTEVVGVMWEGNNLSAQSDEDTALMALFLQRLQKDIYYYYPEFREELWYRSEIEKGTWELDNGVNVEFTPPWTCYHVDYDTLKNKYPEAYEECVKYGQRKGRLDIWK